MKAVVLEKNSETLAIDVISFTETRDVISHRAH